MYIFSQFVGILASTLNIGKYFIKEEKELLIMMLGTCFFIGTTLILVSAYTGAICYMIFGTMAMCNYMYEIKNENIPKNVFIAYGIGLLIAIILSYKKIYDLIIIFIVLSYMVSFFKKDNKKIYRFTEIINNIILTIYSAFYGGYTLMISTIACVVVLARDIYKYDIKKEVEPVTEIEVELNKEKLKQEYKKQEEENNSTDNILLTSSILTGRNVSSRIKGRKILGKTTSIKYSKSQSSKYSNNKKQRFTKK